MGKVIEFLDDYNIQYWETHSIVSDGYIGVNCVLCGDMEKPYMGLRKDGNLSSFCWRCGYHSPVDTVEALTGISNKAEIYAILKKYKGESSGVYHRAEKDDIKRVSKVILPGKPDLVKPARKYLISRKFDPDFLIAKYGLQSTTYDYPSYRVIFPFWYNHRIVSWTGRSYSKDSDLRWLSAKPEAEVLSHKDIFFNWDNQKKGGNVLLVEGILDAVRTGGLATAGTSVTRSQLLLLKTFSKVWIMFDGSYDAIVKAHEVSVVLTSIGVDNEVLELEDGDPDTEFMDEAELIYLKKDLQLS